LTSVVVRGRHARWALRRPRFLASSPLISFLLTGTCLRGRPPSHADRLKAVGGRGALKAAQTVPLPGSRPSPNDRVQSAPRQSTGADAGRSLRRRGRGRSPGRPTWRGGWPRRRTPRRPGGGWSTGIRHCWLGDAVAVPSIILGPISLPRRRCA